MDFPDYIHRFLGYRNGGFKEHIEEMRGSSSLFEALQSGLEKLSEWAPEEISGLIQNTGKNLQIKGKQLYHPLRLALTNEEQGPDLPIIMFVMGKEASSSRLHKWVEIIRSRES